jgi:hypothetical protein
MDKIVTKTALEQLAEAIAEKLQELEDRIAALENA